MDETQVLPSHGKRLMVPDVTKKPRLEAFILLMEPLKHSLKGLNGWQHYRWTIFKGINTVNMCNQTSKGKV
ncbi:hypothetical protein L2E82_17388 [Cichorium intybus]|uniref:Uncharacterized protein n=1 Tax=Cichorium intybus TaxID=13427 RepID=A0ACB9F8T0_CICIN|nr:hypothetical protein L2E82_17388 [Cichorium intybus]